MTLEQRIEMHEQWLLSMESNQSQLAASLAALGRNTQAFQEEVRQQFGQITGILEQVVRHQAVLSARMTELAEHQRHLAEQLRQLSETVDRYIRFRGDGREQN